ncbi:restriction endonuclease [Paenibacillus cymbidii]|uniref:restriction endonuclease n=1 Tax=Paenibacillus cymbidii TaxID=1639034 RepID=UPI0010810A66|nr:restriction endonuclease [Paenibacillus cymbidii]
MLVAKKKKNNEVGNKSYCLPCRLGHHHCHFSKFPLVYCFRCMALIWVIPRVIRRQRNQAWRRKVLQSGIEQIDVMKGEQFELYLKVLFEQQGYQVELAPKSNDFGADLILTLSGKRTVVQAKRYERTVGVDAIQQVTGASAHYAASEAWVITNPGFFSKCCGARQNKPCCTDQA